MDVKRKKSIPLKQPATPVGLPLPTSTVPKQTIQQNHVPTVPVFSSYPSLPTSQPYRYVNNSAVGKNFPVPFVTPFAVNHGPTFINLGSHSTIFTKPRLQANQISNGEENTPIVQQPENKELYNLKVPNEPWYSTWQRPAFYNTPMALQDPKKPASSNTMAQNAFMQVHGNYHKYPSTYFNNNMFHVPQLGYRNYGDTSDNISYQNLRNHAFPTNPYLPFSTFPTPPFIKPGNLHSLEHSPALPTKAELPTVSTPTTTTKLTSLESFSVFTSYVPKGPKMEINEEIISELTAENEKEFNSVEKE